MTSSVDAAGFFNGIKKDFQIVRKKIIELEFLLFLDERFRDGKFYKILHTGNVLVRPDYIAVVVTEMEMALRCGGELRALYSDRCKPLFH